MPQAVVDLDVGDNVVAAHVQHKPAIGSAQDEIQCSTEEEENQYPL